MYDSRIRNYGIPTVYAALCRKRKTFRGRSREFSGKSDAGNPHVRFDEQGVETNLWRNERETAGGKTMSTPNPKDTAPFPDSTF